MCTLVLLRRPDHVWPVLMATNRDERMDRPWSAPGCHWPQYPDVVGGLDHLGGGSWLGMNRSGVVAGVLNRVGTLGPREGMRSRGELVLRALSFDSAGNAARGIASLAASRYQPFNLVIVDRSAGYWLRHRGDDGPGRIEEIELPIGLSMFTAHDRNDLSSSRIRKYLSLFEAAAVPDPETGDWSGWTRLLARTESLPGTGPEEAMTIVTDYGFGTLSSSLIALPHAGSRSPTWLFARRGGDNLRFGPVTLSNADSGQGVADGEQGAEGREQGTGGRKEADGP